MPDTPAQPAPDPALDATLQQLNELPGMDVPRGLKSLRGKAGLYLSLLRQLVSSHRADAELIRRHLAAGQANEAHLVAHTLKGTAATLGAAALAEAAAHADALLREAALPVDPAMLERLLEVMVGEIDKVAGVLAAGQAQ